MFCHNCGMQINDNEVFCHHCGAKLQEETLQNNAPDNPTQINSTYSANTSSLSSGIMLVWIGLIIEIVAQIPHFVSSNAAGSSTTVYLWLAIGGAIVMLIGLFQLAPFNRLFAKARMYCVAFIVESAVMGILMGIIGTVASYSVYFGSYAGVYGLIVVDIIYCVLTLFLELLMMKTIIEGFISIGEENYNVSIKCRSAYFHYMISKTLICVFTVIALFITIGWMTTGAGYPAIVAFGVILLLCYIYSAAVLAYLVYWLYQVVKIRNNINVSPTYTPPVSELIKD